VICVEGREVLCGLIVCLNCGQFIDEVFTAVEFADFGQVNVGEPVLHFRVFLRGRGRKGVESLMKRTKKFQ